MKPEVRIDKWLWAVRLFKTRTLACEACKKGKILVNNISVKPSHVVKIGEIICVKNNPVLFSFKVIDIAHNRMAAKLVPNFLENVTTPDQLELLEVTKLSVKLGRERGTGRPTKKERRDLDDYTLPYFIDHEFGLEND